MPMKLAEHLQKKLSHIKSLGLYKSERIMTSPQGSWINTEGKKVINLCANNYLGLSNHPELIQTAQQALTDYGFGLSSVRFICGTQNIHKELEEKISAFLGMEDTLLYSSCFDANTGLFETLLESEDAIISDSLNHASIIDGVRLCKAQRYRYKNNDMNDLETCLKKSSQTSARFKLIVTDGVFSMDGSIAKLKTICDLAQKYKALVMVDDSHGVGFMGQRGRGTHEHCDVWKRVDILTGTLGKALGGASGGYTSASRPLIEWLRQRSRPYLFSNSLSPSIVKTSLKALEILESSDELRQRLKENSYFFRTQMQAQGFHLLPGDHPIIPVMLGDAALAKKMADELLKEGIYVIGFSYPVVPKEEARIRTQISAAHTQEDLKKAVAAFTNVGKKMGVI